MLADQGLPDSSMKAARRNSIKPSPLQVGDEFQPFHGCHIAGQGVSGVVPIKLRLLEGQQVVLLLENADAPPKGFTLELDPRDEDAVKGLHKKRAIVMGSHRAKFLLIDLPGVCYHPLILPITVLRIGPSP